jgi:DNA-binding XRE family transcriptional regulator
LRGVYDKLSLRYERTKDKALLSFLQGFLRPCLKKQVDLKAIRAKHNLTTRQLAKKLGISNSMVTQIEKGHRPLPIRLARKLERFKLTA